MRHFPIATASFFLPGDRTIVSGGEDGIRLWDAQNGKLLRHLKTPRRVVSLHSNQDGSVLVAQSKSGILQFFDTKTWEEGTQIKLRRAQNAMMALSPDGKLVVATTDRTVQIFDDQGQEVKNYTGRLPQIQCMAVSPDGKTFAFGTENSLGLWDLPRDQLRDQLLAQPEPVQCVVFNASGELLAAGTATGTIQLWNLKKEKQLASLEAGSNPIRSVLFSDDGRRVSCITDEGLFVWELRTLKLRSKVAMSIPAGVERFAISTDGSCAVVGSDNGIIAVHDWILGRDRFLNTGHRGPILTAFQRDNHVYSWSEDGTARQWDDQGREQRRLEVPGIKMVAVSGTWVAGLDDNGVGLWDAESAKGLRRLEGDPGEVHALAVSPDRSLVVAGCDDNKIWLWNAETGKRLHVLEAHEKKVGALAFSPDSKQLVSGSLDGRICLWDTAKGTLVRSFRRRDVGIACVAFHPQGNSVAVGGLDSIIRFFDPETGKQTGNCLEQQFGVSVLAYSPNGKQLASGSNRESAILVWDAESGKKLTTLDRHHAGVGCLSFDGNDRLLSGSVDSTIYLWTLR